MHEINQIPVLLFSIPLHVYLIYFREIMNQASQRPVDLNFSE